jgi:hypothetical protein
METDAPDDNYFSYFDSSLLSVEEQMIYDTGQDLKAKIKHHYSKYDLETKLYKFSLSKLLERYCSRSFQK